VFAAVVVVVAAAVPPSFLFLFVRTRSPAGIAGAVTAFVLLSFVFVIHVVGVTHGEAVFVGPFLICWAESDGGGRILYPGFCCCLLFVGDTAVQL
jgi:hypothetical protein